MMVWKTESEMLGVQVADASAGEGSVSGVVVALTGCAPWICGSRPVGGDTSGRASVAVGRWSGTLRPPSGQPCGSSRHLTGRVRAGTVRRCLLEVGQTVFEVGGAVADFGERTGALPHVYRALASLFRGRTRAASSSGARKRRIP